MATLEKIRSKSVLLVSVIGVALVLFIITLVDNPFAMFQDHTSIAKLGGQTVTVEQFNRRTEMAQQQMSQQGNQNVDNAMLQAQVLQQLLQEKLLGAEYDKLGIAVSDEELTEAMTGNNAVAYVRQWAQQFGVTPAQL
ncbi:MAG: SurA N-terminal domain-containing protein [Muribaculaceae bacterium]|nr:SurA N-terminal domain-containing protein [Muribaculaceae bacterium]